jgi:nicotinate phosphoribosyltransferase
VVVCSYFIYTKLLCVDTHKNELNTNKGGYLAKSYKNLNPLMTDFYQLTMSSVFFHEGRKDEEGTFYMYWRNPPFKGNYTLASGLEGVIDFLNNFQFKDEDIAYLSTITNKDGTLMFKKEFLDFLRKMKLDLDVEAVPEGTVMVGQGPVIRVSGPIIQCLLVESAILNIINSSSIVSTRASRLSTVLAKENAACIDFSLRRSPSLDIMVARAAFIGGLQTTATTNSGKELGIPIVGTMAHSFITSFQQDGLSNSDVERLAFRTYLRNMPGNSVLLIDTFDPKRGIVNALKVAAEMKIPLVGLRIDSGDIYELSWYAKEQIDKFNKQHSNLFKHTNIFLTDGLDEIKIRDLFERSRKENRGSFPAKKFGVGTNLGNPGPLSGGVYKLSAFRPNSNEPFTPTMKLSGKRINPKDLVPEKSSLPGAQLNTLRLYNEDGKVVAEVIVDTSENNSDIRYIEDNKKAFRFNGSSQTIEDLPKFTTTKPLLVPIFKRQKGSVASLVYNVALENSKSDQYIDSLRKIREFSKVEINAMPDNIKDLEKQETIPLYISVSVYENAKKIIEKNSVIVDIEKNSVIVDTE